MRLASKARLLMLPVLLTCCALFHTPTLQDKLQDRAPGAFGGYRGGRREAGLLAAACEAYAGAHTIWIVLADVSIAACGMSANVG